MNILPLTDRESSRVAVESALHYNNASQNSSQIRRPGRDRCYQRRHGPVDNIDKTIMRRQVARSPRPKKNQETSTTIMLRWLSLPLELRFSTLELLAQENLSFYASVCEEWQAVIKKKTFRRLKLQPSCLDDLEYMTRGRKELVKHIWLNMELQRYTNRIRSTTGLPPWMSGNDAFIRKATTKLFFILRTWDPGGGGLTFELTTQSPIYPEYYGYSQTPS